MASLAEKLQALAEKAEPDVAKAIRDLLISHLADIDMDALEAAARAGDVAEVMEVIGATDPVKAQAVVEALQDAVWEGGKLIAQESKPLYEARFVFNRLNPALIRWLDTYTLELIRDIDDGTREAVRAALVKGMNAGDNPIQTAREIRQVVGLTERQAMAVLNFRRELESIHTRRSVKAWGLGNQRSRRSGLDVLELDEDGRPKDGIEHRRLRDQRYDAQIRRAVESKNPLTPEQINTMVERYQERYIQHRARTIARTEALRATNVGVQEGWRQAINEGVLPERNVRKLWIVSDDERACPICAPIPRLNPKEGVMLEGRFRSPQGLISIPPVHPNCRCTTFVRHWEDYQLEAFEAERARGAA